MCKWRHRVVFKSSLNIENCFPPSTNITAAEYLKVLMPTPPCASDVLQFLRRSKLNFRTLLRFYKQEEIVSRQGARGGLICIWVSRKEHVQTHISRSGCLKTTVLSWPDHHQKRRKQNVIQPRFITWCKTLFGQRWVLACSRSSNLFHSTTDLAVVRSFIWNGLTIRDKER